jgi:uncharacterized protein YdaU (DUF1376 family)
MAFKVNYNQQRIERDRAKQAKKDAKLREKQAEVERRRTREESPGPTPQAQEDDPNGPA